jgi:hypothetical protein
MTMNILRSVCLALLLLPGLSMGAEPLLLDEGALSKKVEQNQDYQLIDARNPEAQRLAPIAFSTCYRINVTFIKGLVLIVADTDADALAIARSVPAAPGRSAFAVKGGFEAWQREAAKASPATSVSKDFVIPKNTCEQGKPIQELKRDKPLQQFKAK